LEGYTKVKKAAKYSGVSERTFRDWLDAGLKHIQLPTGRILVKYSAIDDYLSGYEVIEDNNMDKLIDAMVSEVLGA
jgi:predicted site-specific integrase-resolvase